MENNIKYLVWLTAVLFLFMAGCTPCNDCGPSEAEPYITIRLFNIDSLIKINGRIGQVEDSLRILDEMAGGGDPSLENAKAALESELYRLQLTRVDIQKGKNRIDSLYGMGAQSHIFFKNPDTNDTLSAFRFPLNMNGQSSTYLVDIPGRTDTLTLNYELKRIQRGRQILLQAYSVQVSWYTYDSVNVQCKNDSCISNETSIDLYF